MFYLLSSVLPIQSVPNKQRVAQCSGLASIIVMLGLALSLSACQKSPETKAQTTAESSTISSADNEQDTDKINDSKLTRSNDLTTSQAPSDSLNPLQNAPDSANMAPNLETLTPQQPRGTQVTDVQYHSAAGETLSVVFQTSATGVLNAVITLSNNTTLTLSAPEGQGNNPTYRSADGKIELVSHQGGTVIDLIRNGTVTSFTAVSAEAEVITQT